MKKRLLEGKKLECFALVLFVMAYAVVTAFHEPWFDEAQAWQIAKCASLKDMLLEIPHYEGHPPLWWLILSVPAKLGVPFEIGLKSIGFIITLVSVYLILFKMPYPRLMRLSLPFSYFVFYQYGVIVRPYGIMMLTFLLMVLVFPKRKEKPWQFTGLLTLLCLSSAYGIMMAGGIAICMVWELIEEKGFKGFVSALFTDKRTLSLGVLLITAILLILEFMPQNNTLVSSKNANNGFALCLICALLTFLGECTLTTSSWFAVDRTLLQHVDINRRELVMMCILGCILWILIVGASSKKSLKYFLVPYILLASFAAAVYFNVHHIGIIYLLLLFWIGILMQDDGRFEIGKAMVDKIAKTARDRKLLKNAALLICAACLCVPMYWCLHASMLDVKYEYSYGRYASSFLEEHDLENSLIFFPWGVKALASDDETIIQKNTYDVSSSVLVNAYFDRNICYNLNRGLDNEAFMYYRLATEAEDEQNISAWKNEGVPDIVVGKDGFEQVYGENNLEDYTLVDTFPMNYIWKNTVSRKVMPIFARNDIMDAHGLEEIKDARTRYWVNSFAITDEMREQFENGVPVEEILKPYLDAMFGEQK